MAEELEVIRRHYDLLLWLVPTVQGYPRAHRFALGERTEHAAYDVLERLIEARYDAGARAANLKRANVALERLRFLLRLACDLRVLARAKYLHATELVDDVGRQVGGWLRAGGRSPPRPRGGGPEVHRAPPP